MALLSYVMGMLDKSISKIEVFREIRAFLSERPNWKAYVIGGFVRDLLMHEDSKDIDIVVTSTIKRTDEIIGIAFAKELCTYLGIGMPNVFENFGTANFKYKGIEIEIVGARKESYERGSRKPIVEDGTLDNDISRRDFTINAMAISLNPEDSGFLIDKFEGLKALDAGVIRTPLHPGITFSDDPLRMLRAIRFASRFNFEIEGKTFEAIKDNASRLKIISAERIVGELDKILLSSKPSTGLKLLYDSNLLWEFLPELAEMNEVKVIDGKGHKNNFLHTIEVVDNVRGLTDSLPILYAALFHDIGKVSTRRFDAFFNKWTFHNHEAIGAKIAAKIMIRLKLPIQDWGAHIDTIIRYHGKVKELALDESSDITISDAAIRRLVVETDKYLNDLLLFARCDMTTRHAWKREQYLRNYDALQNKIYEVAERDALRNFKVPVTGEDIMQRYSLPPSKPVGLIKEAIKNAILDGLIQNDRTMAWEYMEKVAPQFLIRKEKTYE